MTRSILRMTAAAATVAAGICVAQSQADAAIGPISPCPPGQCAAVPLVVPESGGSFSFTNPVSGNWFDPPFVDGFDFLLTGGTFATLLTPPASFGFGPVELFVGGVDEGTIAPGAGSSAVNGATEFKLVGITPNLDEGSLGFSSAFPTQLTFNGTPTNLTITALEVPEPFSMLLFGSGLAGLAAARRVMPRGGKDSRSPVRAVA